MRDPRTGVDVVAVEHGSDIDGAPWVVLDAGGGRWLADHVVVATGYNHTPVAPSWPGQDGFTGEVIHASAYRNPGPFIGRSALVVGTGNTGCEIAQDLAEHAVSPVWLSYRTAPHILRRTTGPVPQQWTGVAVRRLPPRVVDRLGAVVERISMPDLTAYGLPRPQADLYSRVDDGSIPVQDVGIVAAIRNRSVLPVPTIERFEAAQVVLVDGQRLRPDVVIVAAGYSRGLEPMLGALGVLRADGCPVVHGAHNPPGAAGLWFNGFTNPISGMLREIAMDAKAIAAAIIAE